MLDFVLNLLIFFYPSPRHSVMEAGIIMNKEQALTWRRARSRRNILIAIRPQRRHLDDVRSVASPIPRRATGGSNDSTSSARRIIPGGDHRQDRESNTGMLHAGDVTR